MTPPIASETPIVVCLCGSSRWPELHHRAMMEETLAGNIVIPMGLYGRADYPLGSRAATADSSEANETKQMLDRMHFRKIDLADEIVVVTRADYIGASTRREITYAEERGKKVRYWNASSAEVPRDELVSELLAAWEDFQRYGQHDGDCTFGSRCGECGTPSGRCDKHGETMTARQSRMDDVIRRLEQQQLGRSVSSRDKEVWRAAMTLAHNLCIQTSNSVNDEDGDLSVVHALADEARRIRGWMQPSDEQLLEMFDEAGVNGADE